MTVVGEFLEGGVKEAKKKREGEREVTERDEEDVSDTRRPI